MERDQAQLNRRWRFVAAPLVVVGLLIFLFRPEGSPPRKGSRVVDAEVDVSSRTLDAYAITYDIETYTDAGKSVLVDDVFVQRPYRSRVLARSETGGTETINAFGKVSVRGTVFNVPPGAADADRRPDAVLPEALDAGYAEVRETRRVAGRNCVVHRIGDGQESGTMARLDDAYTLTDVCVDEAGLILEEATFDGTDLVRRRIARSVDEQAKVAGDLFKLKASDADPQVIGSVQTLEDDSRLPGDEFWQLSRKPKGFRFQGRFAVIPAGQPGFSDLSSRGTVVTFMSEVWTDGIDVLVIDQGASRGTKPFEPDPNARRIVAGDLGRGEMRYSLRESEVRVLTSDVRFVRARGTLPPSRLLAIARTLEAVDGGPLRVKAG